MNTTDFWKLYLTTEHVPDIFDITYDFFSNELPQEFIENYDVEEVVLETLGHNKAAKEYDRVLRFSQLLQSKHPAIYLEIFQYIDNFLIEYYCYCGNQQEVEKAFSNFANNPLHDYDKLFSSLKMLQFYQYSNIVDNTISNIYKTIKASDKFWSKPEITLSVIKFSIQLEAFYSSGEINRDLYRNEFIESLIPYDFTITKEGLLPIESALFTNDFTSEGLNEDFFKKKSDSLLTLKTMFMREMKAKGVHFFLSATFWELMEAYWSNYGTNKKKKADNYFSPETRDFEGYIASLQVNFYRDTNIEMFATLWASVYVYDFLYEHGLISKENYSSFITISKKLKGRVIYLDFRELWLYDFVHRCVKPNSISDQEFHAEAQIFAKSFSSKAASFSDFKEEIAAELDEIGPLSEFIAEAEKDPELVRDFDNNLISLINDSDPLENQGYVPNSSMMPAKAEPKVGRNEPCPCGSGKKYKKCCGN